MLGDYFKNHGYVHNELTQLMCDFDINEILMKNLLGVDSINFRWLTHSKPLPNNYERIVLFIRVLIVCGYDLKLFSKNLSLISGVPF